MVFDIVSRLAALLDVLQSSG